MRDDCIERDTSVKIKKGTQGQCLKGSLQKGGVLWGVECETLKTKQNKKQRDSL